MQPSRSHALAHGILAGLLAGAVVALWFLVVDIATAEAFRTPAVLAGALMGAEREPTVLLVLSYTLIHFAVFAALGLGAAAALRATGVAPGLLLGAAVGIAVLDAVHYGALLIAGRGVLSVLPTAHVLLANLLAGVAMMAWLHRAWRAESSFGIGSVRTYPLIERGLVTGAIGAAAVALWMFAVDLVSGRALFTPAALGSVFFLDAETPADVRVTFTVVTAYTLLHLVAFAIVGLVVEWAAERLERMPELWLVALLTMIVVEALFIGTVGVVAPAVLSAVSLAGVVTANAIALAVMGGWVWMRHPRLRREIQGRVVSA